MARGWAKEDWFIKGARKCGLKPLDAARMGATTEMSVCRFFGIEPEFTVGESDGGVDVVIPGLGSYNIKSVKHERQYSMHLVIAEHLKKTADAYMMTGVNVDQGRVTLIGTMSKEDVVPYPVRDHFRKNMRCRKIPIKDLDPVPESIAYYPPAECPDDPKEMWSYLWDRVEV